jgi:hypothetical protein
LLKADIQNTQNWSNCVQDVVKNVLWELDWLADNTAVFYICIVAFCVFVFVIMSTWTISTSTGVVVLAKAMENE